MERRGLTCVSDVEEHGAGGHGEVGDVGPQLHPLHRDKRRETDRHRGLRNRVRDKSRMLFSD